MFAQLATLIASVIFGWKLVASSFPLYLLGLGKGYDFYQFCFAVAERNLVAHDLIFHGILQRGIQQDLNGLAFDEAHFHDALAKAPVAEHFHDDAFFSCL